MKLFKNNHHSEIDNVILFASRFKKILGYFRIIRAQKIQLRQQQRQ